MASSTPLQAIIAAEALLVLVLLSVNLYCLFRRPIRQRIKEIYFINDHQFRLAWYVVLVATVFLVASQTVTLFAVLGEAAVRELSRVGLVFQFVSVTLMILAFAMTFRVFARYIRKIPVSDFDVDARVERDMRRAILREEPGKQPMLDLSGVGDVYSGRKRLGPYVSLTHYRGLTIGFTHYMQDRLGQMGDAILYTVGRLTATAAMADILREIQDKETALRRIFDEIRANGIAIPEVVHRTENQFILRLHENVTSAGVQPSGRAICHYQSGMLAGVFEQLVGRRVMAAETKCWGLGDRFCEFQLDVDPRGTRAPPQAAPLAETG